MRSCIYTHLTAIVICASFSLADRGLLVSPTISEAAEPLFNWVFLPSLLALVVCPALVLIVIVCGKWTSRQSMAAVLAEALLVPAHVFALLPACS